VFDDVMMLRWGEGGARSIVKFA